MAATEIRSEWIEYQSRGATVKAYFAAPLGADPSPGVVMIHENPGMTEHRLDVTRRLARAGYATLTPDLFSRIGGKPPVGETDVDRRRKIDLALPDDRVFDDLINGHRYLVGRPEAIAERIALYGICMGGGKGFYTVCRTDVFRCFVDFYGPVIMRAEATSDGRDRSYLPLGRGLSCPMQYHVGDQDTVCPPDQVERLRQHAFHDDSARRYHGEAATLAWERAIKFFQLHLTS
jgi:carboxymethylenebutenolidase